MAWSFRKRIKIIPGVNLNLSKSGISTSIGVKGASITFGKSGTFLNTSVPMLGIYNRKRLSKSDLHKEPYRYNLPNALPSIETTAGNIFSADIQEITSQNMHGVKEAILMAHEQRNELNNDLLRIRTTIGNFKFKLIASYVLLYGLIKRSIAENIKTDIKAQQEAISQIQAQIENCYVELDTNFEPEISEKYNQVVYTFKQLITSHKIWDVTSAHFQDRIVTRSSASKVVSKREVRFAFKSLPDIRSNFETLCFQNANGADLYFYPSFIVMYSSKTSFALIGIDELDFHQSYVRFTEDGTVPRDSKVIDKTWYKVNKNGTPDKRFKGNYQIPIVKYGEISLQTVTGLHEEYEFSNYEFTAQFGEAFKNYQNIIKSLKQL
ncbi:DUF4236 domain-containing protein [Pedobacter boryungensis]|uniref:DUF4236 domain-containing protein n=1 Tax=Pedobacter boryungensis TaxID=869962 RepID=A0ABX2DDR6_9SPHI|nr:DUF4236 domain-containing protein [Pedobacter boryungensis]NQX31583.1 DUF4236 domain-containing protein [Pedobacter boryungensis]